MKIGVGAITLHGLEVEVAPEISRVQARQGQTHTVARERGCLFGGRGIFISHDLRVVRGGVQVAPNQRHVLAPDPTALIAHTEGHVALPANHVDLYRGERGRVGVELCRSPGRVTKMYKSASLPDSHVPLFLENLDTSEFAGVVCVEDDPDPLKVVRCDGELDKTPHACRRLSGVELWKSDGTAFGTQRVVDLAPGSRSSRPSGLVSGFGNTKLLFAAQTREYGAEVFVLDDNSQELAMLADIGLRHRDSWPKHLTSASDESLVFFQATHVAHGAELWTTDGRPAFQFVPLAEWSMKSPLEFQHSNLDQLRTRMVTDLAAGQTSSTPEWLTPIPTTNVVVFAASTPHTGVELFASDGTEIGTGLVMDINPGKKSSWPSHLVVFQTKVFLAADDGTSGTELWHTGADHAVVVENHLGATVALGNPAVLAPDLTFQLKDINKGAASSRPSFLTPFTPSNRLDDTPRLYFVANAHELWSSDGTTHGTHRVFTKTGKDFDQIGGFHTNKDLRHVAPRTMIEYDNSLYFTALNSNTRKTLGKTKNKMVLRQPALQVFDVDIGDKEITLQFSCEKGLLEFPHQTGIEWLSRPNQKNPCHAVWRASLADANNALKTMKYHARDHLNGVDLINVAANDTISLVQATIQVTIKSVNSPPKIELPVSAKVGVILGIKVSDPDMPQGTEGVLTVELHLTRGFLSLYTTRGLDLDSPSAKQASVVRFTARPKDIQQALARIYVEDDPDLEPESSTLLTIRVNDNGFTGKGGELLTEGQLVVEIPPHN